MWGKKTERKGFQGGSVSMNREDQSVVSGRRRTDYVKRQKRRGIRTININKSRRKVGEYAGRQFQREYKTALFEVEDVIRGKKLDACKRTGLKLKNND